MKNLDIITIGEGLVELSSNAISIKAESKFEECKEVLECCLDISILQI